MNDKDGPDQDKPHDQAMWEGTASLAEEIDRLRAELIAYLADNIDKPGAGAPALPQRMIDAIDAQAKAAIARHLQGSALANPDDFAARVMAAVQPQNDQIRQDAQDTKARLDRLSSSITALTHGISQLGERPMAATPPLSIADEHAASQIKEARKAVRDRADDDDRHPDWDERPAAAPRQTWVQKFAIPLALLTGGLIGAGACGLILSVTAPAPAPQQQSNVPPGMNAVTPSDETGDTAADPATGATDGNADNTQGAGSQTGASGAAPATPSDPSLR